MRRTTIPAVILVALLSLAGCSAPSSEQSDSGGGTTAPGPAYDEGVTGEVAAPEEALDREVITTGYMTVTAADPIDAADEAIRITEQAGGRVDARTEYAPVDGDQGSARLTLRLPSATLTASIDKLRKLGEVEEISLSTLDVTTEARDLDARITALRASIDRLLVLLTKSTDTDSLIALETAISDRQATLESMESQRRYLSDQVSLSTIELSLISEADAPPETPDNFWTGLVAGWNSVVAAASGLLVALGVLLPWIVILGAIAAVVVLVVRSRQRKRATPEK